MFCDFELPVNFSSRFEFHFIFYLAALRTVVGWCKESLAGDVSFIEYRLNSGEIAAESDRAIHLTSEASFKLFAKSLQLMHLDIK